MNVRDIPTITFVAGSGMASGRGGDEVARWPILDASFDSRVSDGFRVETGIPGAVVTVTERPDGVIEERNGAGSIVSLVYPIGVDGLTYSGGEWWAD